MAGRRKRRSRKGREINLVGWAIGIGGAVVAGRLLLSFASAYWPYLVAVTVLALVATVAFLLLKARAVTRRQQEWLAAHQELSRVDQLSGPDFEKLTAALLRRDGFRDVREVGRTADRGVDVIAIGPGGQRFAFQCKRYTGTVGSPEVRNFLGALAHTFAGHTGILVTSSRLTRHALAEALAAKLILVQRDQLASWLQGTPLTELYRS
ncbi:restriction endonuclease [Streptosporangium sp. NPDC000396]|uniref:restriction endonuclease n=1 Tax=Streptosporangium sp. NPDC000396 TaxID=3366185 RepID=UPI0036A96322